MICLMIIFYFLSGRISTFFFVFWDEIISNTHYPLSNRPSVSTVEIGRSGGDTRKENELKRKRETSASKPKNWFEASQASLSLWWEELGAGAGGGPCSSRPLTC